MQERAFPAEGTARAKVWWLETEQGRNGDMRAAGCSRQEREERKQKLRGGW